MKAGRFRECTFGQLLMEQERLIGGLNLKDTIYFGSHPSNIVPMQGRLPEHREEMLEILRRKREEIRDHLDESPRRGPEGSILNR